MVQEEPRSPGIYGPIVQLPEPGTWDLQLSIESPQLGDTIRVSDLPVQPNREAVGQRPDARVADRVDPEDRVDLTPAHGEVGGATDIGSATNDSGSRP